MSIIPIINAEQTMWISEVPMRTEAVRQAAERSRSRCSKRQNRCSKRQSSCSNSRTEDRMKVGSIRACSIEHIGYFLVLSVVR